MLRLSRALSASVLILLLLAGCSAPAVLSVNREAKCYAQLSEARRATGDDLGQRVDALLAVAHTYSNCPHAATAIQQAVHLVIDSGEPVQIGRLHRALTQLTNRSDTIAVEAAMVGSRSSSRD